MRWLMFCAAASCGHATASVPATEFPSSETEILPMMGALLRGDCATARASCVDQYGAANECEDLVATLCLRYGDNYEAFARALLMRPTHGGPHFVNAVAILEGNEPDYEAACIEVAKAHQTSGQAVSAVVAEAARLCESGQPDKIVEGRLLASSMVSDAHVQRSLGEVLLVAGETKLRTGNADHARRLLLEAADANPRLCRAAYLLAKTSPTGREQRRFCTRFLECSEDAPGDDWTLTESHIDRVDKELHVEACRVAVGN